MSLKKKKTSPSLEHHITPGNADIMIKLSKENLLFKIFQLKLNQRPVNEYKLKTKN